MEVDGDLYGIGALARRTGVSVRTLRFWCDSGVVPATTRSAAGHRLYDDRAMARVELVATLRKLGLGLRDIRAVLEDRTRASRRVCARWRWRAPALPATNPWSHQGAVSDLPPLWCDPGRGWYSQSNMDNRSDAIIVAEVLAGDTEAYACLVNRYQNEYFRFAVRMLGGRDDADEALQSAFLRAFRALAQCREPERFGAWLYQIVANECRSKATMRARRERRFVRDDDALASALAEQPAEPAAMDEEIERAIEQLEVDQREAFLLKYVEELTYEEMEAITGAGKSALKMRVKRACDRLRELLDGAYHA